MLIAKIQIYKIKIYHQRYFEVCTVKPLSDGQANYQAFLKPVDLFQFQRICMAEM